MESKRGQRKAAGHPWAEAAGVDFHHSPDAIDAGPRQHRGLAAAGWQELPWIEHRTIPSLWKIAT